MLSTAEILAIPEDKRRAATASGPPGVWLEILCLNDVCTQAEGKEGKLATPDLKRFRWRKHVDIERVLAAEGSVEELLAIVKNSPVVVSALWPDSLRCRPKAIFGMDTEIFW